MLSSETTTPRILSQISLPTEFVPESLTDSKTPVDNRPKHRMLHRIQCPKY